MIKTKNPDGTIEINKYLSVLLLLLIVIFLSTGLMFKICSAFLIFVTIGGTLHHYGNNILCEGSGSVC